MTSKYTVKKAPLLKFLLKNDFRQKRQKGSHIIFHRPGLSRPIVISAHHKEVDIYLIKQIGLILNLSPEELVDKIDNQ